MVYKPRHKRLNIPFFFFFNQRINTSVNLLFTFLKVFRSDRVEAVLELGCSTPSKRDWKWKESWRSRSFARRKKGTKKRKKGKEGKKTGFDAHISRALHNGARVEWCGKGHRQGAAVSTIGLPINIDLSFADSERGQRSPPRLIQTKGTVARGEKGASSTCRGKIPPSNLLLTVKPINLWIHVSKIAYPCSLSHRGERRKCVKEILVSLLYPFRRLYLVYKI